ncbi:hypothetical protein E8E11_003178 [Didymella keratinophila]|nr:hypothetical protein E8E11_003178 [Didymella keratinophila]
MAQVLDLSIPQIYDGLARDDLEEPHAVDALLDVPVLQSVQWTTHHTATPSPPSKSPLESLPTEIVNQILSHLVHPRSRLPGLTEAQSAHDFPRPTKLEIKNREDLTTLPDSQRWAADIFDFQSLRHPFHALALTSKRLNALVESYCGHLVRTCNMFNLPFAHFDKYGAAYPDLSQITVDEVERQYHISIPTISSSPQIRGPGPGSPWVLRVDVEAMAFRLYGTRAFHAAHVDQFGKPCSICAITRFEPQFSAARSERGFKRGTTRPVRRVGSLKRKARRSRGFGGN